MRNLVIVLMLCLMNSAFAKNTCDFKLKKYCAKLEFLKKPSRSYSSDFKIYFTDLKSSKKAMPTQKVFTYLWMKMKNGHEHGSDKVKITRKKDHFLVENVWFVMIGNWQLHLLLKKDGKVIDKQMKIIEIGK